MAINQDQQQQNSDKLNQPGRTSQGSRPTTEGGAGSPQRSSDTGKTSTNPADAGAKKSLAGASEKTGFAANSKKEDESGPETDGRNDNTSEDLGDKSH